MLSSRNSRTTRTEGEAMAIGKKGLIAGLIGAGFAFCTPAAFAQAPEAGWYAGGTLGQAEVQDFCSAFGGPGISCDEKDTAWRLRAGYQINRTIAVEFGYHHLGEATVSDATASLSPEFSAWELLAVGMLPVSNQFSIYGKAGFFRGETEISATLVGVGSGSVKETTIDLTYGIGAQFNVTPRFGIRAEWQRYTDVGDEDTIGEGDVDVLSAG